MRMLFKYLKPYMPRMTMGVFIKFFGTIMELMIPWILSYILDNVVPTKDRRMIFFWGIMMIVCSLAAVVGNILANRVAASVARDIYTWESTS